MESLGAYITRTESLTQISVSFCYREPPDSPYHRQKMMKIRHRFSSLVPDSLYLACFARSAAASMAVTLSHHQDAEPYQGAAPISGGNHDQRRQ